MSELPVITLTELEAEPAFRVEAFGNDDAVRLGMLGAEVIRERGANLAVEVVVRGDLAFRARLGTTGPANDEWLRGKALVALHYGVPSLLVRRRLAEAGRTVADDGLDETYRAHGGSIPILLGHAAIGAITMSGEPDVLDHSAACEAVRRFLR